MHPPLTRATAVTAAAILALSLLTALPAAADEDAPTTPAGEDSPGEEFDALALARETGERVEIPSLTDEKTQHFANPDGSLTAETHAVPVRVRSADGWVDVDTTLVAAEDGLVRPRAAGMDIAFSGGGDAPMARIGIGSNSVELDWNGDLPTPTLEEDRATYADVLPDVDLVLTAGAEGFTQVLVVHTPEAATSPALVELELALAADGVTMSADEHGNIEALGDEGGHSVFTVQAPAMWDSTGQDEAPGEDPLMAPTTGARTATVQSDVGIESIRLVPDQGMLVDETTEFPVYIDPSVSASRPNWAYVDRAYRDQSYYNRNIDSVGVGRVQSDQVYTKRLFFQFSVMARTDHPNTIINSVTLRTEVEWAYDCTSNSYIELHRVDAFNSKTTWNNQPTTRTLQDTQNVKGGWATCPASSGVEFDASNAYQWGLDNNASHIHLRLKERDEAGTTAWRRINTKSRPPVLVVNYNHPPEKPVTSTLSDSLGGVCATDKTEPRLVNNTELVLRAQFRDRDSYWVGQQVKGQFEWKVDGADANLGSSDSAYATVAKWSGGSYRSVTARDLPENELIAYRARGHDQSNWGPWSSWCYLEIDTTKPDSGPEVTSTDYPAGDTMHGSVGHTGDFTFANNGFEDATAYHYSVNDASCSTVIDLDTPGAEVTIPITPRRDGPNLIHARTVDAYGNASECGLAYMFMVAPLNDPVSYFPLDEGTGNVTADVMERGRSAVATGDIDWVRGRLGQTLDDTYRLEGTAVDPVGASHLRADGPVIDTGDAFSVSAWVLLEEGATENLAAVSQDGERNAGFYLGYQHENGGRWVFKQVPHDGNDTSVSHRAISTDQAQTGVWTHLLGTHDPETGELALYVNGSKQGTATQQTPWNAQGDFVISGGLYHGEHVGPWLGAVDDVRVWDRVVLDQTWSEDEDARSEVWDLANRPIALEGRWQLTETEGTTVTDSSDHGLNATLHADPLTAWNQATENVSRAPGVSLDSTEAEHIRTDGPALRTDRSFSVAAWVRLDESGVNSTAASQDGGRHSGFYLGHNSGPQKWVFKQAPYDGDQTQIDHRAFSHAQSEFGRWTHLVGTYDHTTGGLTLYVDGVRQSTVVQESPWNASGDVVIGAAKYRGQLYDAWGGDISDVHLYQGVLSEDDITLIRLGFLPTV